MSKYRIKKIYKVTPNEGEVIEKMNIQRKILWWWRTVTIPIIMATDGKDILEISAFGGKKLECSDEWWYSDEEWEDFFKLIDGQKYPKIGLAWYGKNIVYYDKVKYVFSYNLKDLIG